MKTCIIKNKTGLHARPATSFCTEVRKYKAEINLTVNGKTFNGKSLLNIMTAGIECGDEVLISAAGEDAIQAEENLATFLNTFIE